MSIQPLDSITDAGYDSFLTRPIEPTVQSTITPPTLDTMVSVPFQNVFNTFAEGANEEGGDAGLVGFVSYMDDDATAHNKTVRLDFYKTTNQNIISVQLQSIFTDAFDPITHAQVRPDNISIALNPTKVLTTSSHATGFKYFRYSSGTSIRTGYTPVADEEKITDIFPIATIQAIANGWNYLIIQQNTIDTGEIKYGHAAMNLVINGYINHVLQ